MTFLNLFILALALSMDCFAIAVATAFSNRSIHIRKIVFISAVFGLAHFIMPLLGWLIGDVFKSYIESYDHWLAFALLLIIGFKMIFESIKKGGNKSFTIDRFFVIFLLAIATSIDALIIGLSLALLDFHLLVSAVIISAFAFIISFIGFIVGKRVRFLCGNKAELIGGLALVLIGVKILFEHLN